LVPPELVELYPEDQMPLPASFRDTLDGKPAFQGRAKFRIPPTVTDDQFRRVIAYYYALVTHIDAQVDRLLRALEAQGMVQDTIVAFISDHGEMLGDHSFTEKCLMYEASVRVPCLLSWGGTLPAGTRLRTPLGGVDLMPTLLELAGVEPPSPIDGRSVASAILGGKEPTQQPIFAEIASNEAIYRGAQDPEQLAAHVMVYDGRWKYIRNRFDIDELYDLETDADEMQNLAAQPEHGERMNLMRHQIAEMVCHTGPGPYDWCLSDDDDTAATQ